MMPSGASTTFLFSTKAAMVDLLTVTPTKAPSLAKFKVILSPAASATVPCVAMMTPLFLTSGASNAT